MTISSQVVYKSGNSFTQEEKKIIANTFLENDYLHAKLDTLQSAFDLQRLKIITGDSLLLAKTALSTKKDYIIKIKDEELVDLKSIIKQQKKELIKTKLTSWGTIGGVAICVGGLLYLAIK